MSHPPLPPNCDMLRSDPEGPKLLVWTTIVHDGVDAKQMRRLIAAVAEVAWRKEADRLIEKDPGSEGIVEAIINARAWRRWGEEKSE